VLAAADNGGGVRLWNFDASARGTPLGGSDEAPGPLAFSTAGLLAAPAENRTVRLWDDNGVARGEPMDIGGRVAALAFSPTGDALAVGSDMFQLWKSGRRLWAEPIRGADHVQRIAFAPNGDLIVSGSWLGELQVWNPDGSTRAKRPKQGREMVRGVAVAPGGDFLATAIGGSHTLVQLFNLDLSPRGEPLEGHASAHRYSEAVAGLAFSPAGKLVTGGSGGVIREWTLASREVSAVEVGRPINQLGYWRDALWLRIADDPTFLHEAPAAGGTLFFYDAQHQLVATVLLRPEAALAFTPDGWFSATDWPSAALRIYRPSGQALTEAEMAQRRSPERVLAALKKAGA
jgi:WD40 repeat protein